MEEEKKEELEQHEASDMVSKAREQADRLEILNRDIERNIQKLEALKVEETLAGTATIEPKQKLTDDELTKEEANKYLAATGLKI